MARSRNPWQRIEKGVYRTDDGWAINADWNIDEAAERYDPTYRPAVFEWYLYDAEGDLIDAFATLKAAKAEAEVRRADRIEADEQAARAEVHGPRPVPGKKKGVETEHLVIVKTANRIEHSRFVNPSEAATFARTARGS